MKQTLLFILIVYSFHGWTSPKTQSEQSKKHIENMQLRLTLIELMSLFYYSDWKDSGMLKKQSEYDYKTQVQCSLSTKKPDLKLV